MTALAALAAPPSRDAQLANARVTCRRWIDAAHTANPGPVWDLLSLACNQAEAMGLNDGSFRTFVKTGLRYLRYLRERGIAENRAFEPKVVLEYQLYVARLLKTGNVPPPQEGKARTQKPRPVRRPAEGNEPRLRIGTQKEIVDAVRHLWRIALRNQCSGFTQLPAASPTAALEWRDEEKYDPELIEVDISAIANTPFLPAKGRSRLEHERNVMLGLTYALIPTRSSEPREAVWQAIEIWKVAPWKKQPLQRWPIEALLCGEVALNRDHVLFMTVGRAVPTKSDEYRGVPLVGLLAERLPEYALEWVRGQLDCVRYLRYRSRKGLSPALDQASRTPRALRLLIADEFLTVETLETDATLFRRTHELSSKGYLDDGSTRHELSETEAVAFRNLLWTEAAGTRYRAALQAFATKRPIRDVFAGVALPSREGGVLSDAQTQRIWRDMGWTAKGWTPQRMRANAAQAFELARLELLDPLGPVIGHQAPITTLQSYARETPWVKVRVVELIQGQLGGSR
ncbi:MAG: hypothetical protein AABM40_04780 [Chloroflexota bacterium]